MPFSDQNPGAHGWKKGPAATIVPFAYSSRVGIQSFGGAVTFPNGVASGTEGIWTTFLDELVPQITGGIKQGECFGYENRNNVNTPNQASFHAYGLALDINSVDNPNKAGQNTNGNGKYKIGSWATALAAKYGMEWGGNWDDPMHFEIHLSPDEVAAYSGGNVPSLPASPTTNTEMGTLAGIAPIAIGIVLIGGIILFTMT